MIYAVYNIALDIHKTGSQVALSMIRGENRRKIVISLMENGRPYKFSNGCTAKFAAFKPDGKPIYNTCILDVEKNVIIYNVTSQTTAAIGEVKCQIELIGNDGGLLFSPTFSLIVADKLYNQEPILASSEEFKALTDYIANLEQKVASGEFKGEKGDPGENIVVDQTYNPESLNAQSGKSLAPVFKKKLDWWQPNIEYKKGDIATCMMEYQGSFQLVFMGCITDHISEGETTGDSPIPSPNPTQLDYWYIQKTTVFRADEAVYANNAEFDVNGNNIIYTYATKEELNSALGYISTALVELHAYAQALISANGGATE